MPFTDEDLKRWKERKLILHWNDELAIIARLEAAEIVCDTAEGNAENMECGFCVSDSNDEGKTFHDSECPQMAEIKAWRKAAGK